MKGESQKPAEHDYSSKPALAKSLNEVIDPFVAKNFEECRQARSCKCRQALRSLQLIRKRKLGEFARLL
jgi:hypothetical protein